MGRSDQRLRAEILDANALTPERMTAIGDLFTGTAVRVVDGSIIGPSPGCTWPARQTPQAAEGDTRSSGERREV